MTVRRTLAAGLTLGLLLVAAPAAGKGGDLDGEGDRYHLTNGWAGVTHLSFSYGRATDIVYVGNWNGRGTDSLAVRRDATYHFRNSLSGGAADTVVTYGRAGDVVLMGDWDGDGVDTPVVRRGAQYHVKNSLRGGDADEVITYGRPDDVVLIGDWDGDGTDTLGVRRENVYHLKNSISGGDADSVVTYGRADDEVLVGDWDGRRGDSLGIRRGDVFHIKNSISGGNADIVMAYGNEGDAAFVGDWDGNGTDSIGLRSPERYPAAPPVGSMREYDERMIEMINAERLSRGIGPVRAWPELRAAAVRQSQAMVELGRIQHAAWDTISSEARAAGCSPASEHIVRTWQQRGETPDPRAAMDWYMNSEVHRSGILNPEYRYVATGSVEAGNYAYNTQRFSRACS
ncbi:Cysteine-rich secretory protein family protein [Georgenia satyanarayanai]|uniref:Cysteine-rich secretory protein family protein n=1 Tax=Georgenia satyanarayanai TaxID=860221 RepID=A0A2Y9AFD6_9MICO|nr:CAP domain-containing protein [Georgenia satyanarayanai]PYF99419.1 Cysteine-rich secretory protein family protein [Georgenia satyanarayanai]SSA43231.1 Cysteine-rich secretory protein family protein [Georgenia satyanarayanai]